MSGTDERSGDDSTQQNDSTAKPSHPPMGDNSAPNHKIIESTDPSTSTETSTNPAASPSDPGTDAKAHIESTSEERTQSLKVARQAALAQTAKPPPPSESTLSPSNQPYPSSNFYPPPPPLPSRQPSHHSRSGLITGLQRLGYILSLILGSSAILGLFWSTFILPLLHSSFSARQVLLEQQTSRFGLLVSGLRALRGTSLFPPLPSAPRSRLENHDDTSETSTEERKVDEAEHRSGIEEIISQSSGSDLPLKGRAIEGASNEEGEEVLAAATPLLPLDNLTTLSTSLRSLSNAISSTSTTRVSLLSTLETYTSQLHRDVYLRNDHRSAFSVGLGSLSENLANASGSTALGSSGAAKSDRTEWDDVRKEIRAIKGLLLGRRNFAPQQPVQASAS